MTRGEKFAAQVRKEFALNAGEDVLVDEIAAVLDVLEAGGLSVPEARQQRNLMARLLAALNLPEEGGNRSSETTRKASRAARARWSHGRVNDARSA